ncbi:hypothetical protein HG530_010269 [Fusarium avenaceum]|nr:hypothetical protein HG530_010269 [Fusarium avenaceum]
MDFNAKSDLEGVDPRCRLCSWFRTRVRGGWFCNRCEAPFQHRSLGIEDTSADRSVTSTNTMSGDESSSMQEMDVEVSTGSHSINAGDEDGIPSQRYLNGDGDGHTSQSQDSEGSMSLVSHILAPQDSSNRVEDSDSDRIALRSEGAGSEESSDVMDQDDIDEETTQGATQSWVLGQIPVEMGQRLNEVQEALGLSDRYGLIPRTRLDNPVAELELDFSDKMDIDK